MLYQEDLLGKHDKVQIALERIQHFVPKEGYWVGISGGKDSTVIYDLVHKSEVKAEYWHSLTTIDAPQTIKYIREHQPDVKFLMPKMPLLKRMIEKSIPPLRHRRWCCSEYKENGGNGRLVLTGVRAQESSKRRTRSMTEHCLRGGDKRFLHPIIDWSENEVWEYIETRKLPVNPLYATGLKRIGCILCPMASKETAALEQRIFPKIYQAWERAFERMYAKRIADGKWVPQANAKEWFAWWMNRDTHTIEFDAEDYKGISAIYEDVDTE